MQGKIHQVIILDEPTKRDVIQRPRSNPGRTPFLYEFNSVKIAADANPCSSPMIAVVL
jgi:hypothetical protein